MEITEWKMKGDISSGNNLNVHASKICDVDWFDPSTPTFKPKHNPINLKPVKLNMYKLLHLNGFYRFIHIELAD